MPYGQGKFLLVTYKILTNSDIDHIDLIASATLYEVYKSNLRQNVPNGLGQIRDLGSLATI